MLHRVRAIIFKDDKLLTIKRLKTDITYFVFPGGGVESGEQLEEAMKRECKEELGVNVKTLNKFTTQRFDERDLKQLEHFYLCEIISGELGTGNGPEYNEDSDYEGIHEIEWLDIDDNLLKYDLRPKEVVEKIINSIQNDKKFKS